MSTTGARSLTDEQRKILETLSEMFAGNYYGHLVIAIPKVGPIFHSVQGYSGNLQEAFYLVARDLTHFKSLLIALGEDLSFKCHSEKVDVPIGKTFSDGRTMEEHAKAHKWVPIPGVGEGLYRYQCRLCRHIAIFSSPLPLNL